jgi:hypothetical protein
MNHSTASSVKQLLQTENSALQRIFAKVRELNELNQVLMQHLEPKLAKGCMVANIYSDRLVVMAENAAVATQLRFSTPDLLPALREHPLLREIKTIECRVGQIKV